MITTGYWSCTLTNSTIRVLAGAAVVPPPSPTVLTTPTERPDVG